MARKAGFEPACVQLAFSCLEGRRHTCAFENGAIDENQTRLELLDRQTVSPETYDSICLVPVIGIEPIYRRL